MGYSQDKTRIYTLGDNQSNIVSQSVYSATELLDFRRLKPVENSSLSNVTLQSGDIGANVVRLQDKLKLFGFNPDTSDGIFGPKTEAALKMYQTSHSHLKISGKFDRATRKQMKKQLLRIT